MGLARAMTSLAINTCSQPLIEARWIAVVTKEASIGYFAAEVRMVWPVIPGTHGPIPAARGVPTQRQFDELSRTVAMEICSRVVPGTYRIMNFLFDSVCVALLIAEEKVLTLAAENLVVAV
jgi:hypothetical protein